jgi:hypothetical protein
MHLEIPLNGSARFQAVPDAPVTSFVLNMQSGKKGLLQNTTNICRGVHRTKAKFTAQNGRKVSLSPKLKSTGCGKGRGH